MHKFKQGLLCSLIISSLLITGCATDRKNRRSNLAVAGTDSLAHLKDINKLSRHHGGPLDGIRHKAIEETALSIGAQAGLAAHSKVINQRLDNNAKNLDKAFNFNALILDHNILPPVLQEGRNTLNLETPDAIRISDRQYKILKQARFVTTPPHWREYIWLRYEHPEPPDGSLLPRTKDEKLIWDHYVTQGWHNGIEQAEVIFSENLAQLKEDYKGMLTYLKLLAQNMVSPPFVGKTELGVTGGDDEMRIDDKVLRITAMPALNPRSNEWETALTLHKKGRFADGHEVHQGKLPPESPISFLEKPGDWQPVIKKDEHP